MKMDSKWRILVLTVILAVSSMVWLVTPALARTEETVPDAVYYSNVCEVFSFPQFLEAYNSKVRIIIIKRSMDLSEDPPVSPTNKNIIIDTNVTLTVSSRNWGFSGLVENYGMIRVPGRLSFGTESPNIGDIRTVGHGTISFSTGSIKGVGADMVEYYLGKNSIYDNLSMQPGPEKVNFKIDRNLIIPESKSLWLNINCTLEVPEGVTLVVLGTLTTYNDPIVKGRVVGDIDVGTKVFTGTPLLPGLSYWASQEVYALDFRGVIPATLRYSFQTPLRRDEFTALMVNIYETTKGAVSTYGSPFDDIASSVYKTAVEKAKSIGIIDGTASTKFTPDGLLTREQAAKILCNLISIINGVELELDGTPNYFDSGDISNWATGFIAFAQENKVMMGDSTGRFNPQNNLTREEALIVAERLFVQYDW